MPRMGLGFVIARYTPHLWRVGCNSFDIVCVCECVYSKQMCFFTPHITDVSGVIVLTSCVCPSVRLSVTTLTAERTEIRT